MAFPTTSVLDSFSRADENPLSGGGNWLGPVEPGKDPILLVGNQVGGSALGTSNQRYWATPFGASQEAYFTLSTKYTSGDNVYLLLNIQTPNTAGLDAYYMFLYDNGGTDTMELWRVINNWASPALVASATPTIAAGDQWGVENIAGVIKVYRKPSGGAWGQIGSTYTDGAPLPAGFIGLGTDKTTARFDDFGGGDVVAAAARVPYQPYYQSIVTQ